MRVISEKEVEEMIRDEYDREPHELTPKQRAASRKSLEMRDENGDPLPNAPTDHDLDSVFQPDRQFERIRCMTEGAKIFRERLCMHLPHADEGSQLDLALKAAEAEVLQIIPTFIERELLIDFIPIAIGDDETLPEKSKSKRL